MGIGSVASLFRPGAAVSALALRFLAALHETVVANSNALPVAPLSMTMKPDLPVGGTRHFDLGPCAIMQWEPRTDMATFAYSAGGEQDLQIIKAHARSHGLTIAATFQDAKSWRIPWRQREQGSRLAKLLQPGDHLILSGGGAFAGTADFLATVKDLTPLGITVLLQVKWRTGSASLSIGTLEAPYLEKVASAHADADSQWRSENAAWGLARAAQAGKRYCRHPGYGRRWRGDKRVIDEGECKVAAWIRVWRDEGFSWHQMARALLRRKLKTKDGAEWSAARVRRIYLASSKWRPAKG